MTDTYTLRAQTRRIISAVYSSGQIEHVVEAALSVFRHWLLDEAAIIIESVLVNTPGDPLLVSPNDAPDITTDIVLELCRLSAAPDVMGEG